LEENKAMSQYEAKVIRIAGIRKHENADTL
jgi:hypothetical protein